MLKNCNGFTLLDALTGISILLLFLLFVMPTIQIILSERNVVAERHEALISLHDDLQKWIYSTKREMPVLENAHFNSAKLYVIRRQAKENEITVCMTWFVTADREEELCLHGTKTK